LGLGWDWAIAGGFVAGALAGGAARYGRLCTMSAIEDALVAGDYRAAKAWALAASSAIGFTQLFTTVGWLELGRTLYANPQLHILGAVLGGALFGLGMSLVGTCSFGLLVRAGGGDLRALITALVVGILAFALTAGLLAPLRAPLLAVDLIDMRSFGVSVDQTILHRLGPSAVVVTVSGLVTALAAMALVDRRLRRRPRLLVSAVALGVAVAVGWLMTYRAVVELALDRPESLTFVAPVGRALLQFMTQPFRNVGFGVAAVCGAITAAFAVAMIRNDFRWEAFDDALEMRRHLLGASLMGIGGVFAQGCTGPQRPQRSSVLGTAVYLWRARRCQVGAQLPHRRSIALALGPIGTLRPITCQQYFSKLFATNRDRPIPPSLMLRNHHNSAPQRLG
jgi:uncharacterized protein